MEKIAAAMAHGPYVRNEVSERQLASTFPGQTNFFFAGSAFTQLFIVRCDKTGLNYRDTPTYADTMYPRLLGNVPDPDGRYNRERHSFKCQIGPRIGRNQMSDSLRNEKSGAHEGAIAFQEHDRDDDRMEDEEKILAGRSDVNYPALLTKDVPGG